MSVGRLHAPSLESGGMGIRTPDIQLAKLALYQLSYTPDMSVVSKAKG
jgi:hypothetical protein